MVALQKGSPAMETYGVYVAILNTLVMHKVSVIGFTAIETTDFRNLGQPAKFLFGDN